MVWRVEVEVGWVGVAGHCCWEREGGLLEMSGLMWMLVGSSCGRCCVHAGVFRLRLIWLVRSPDARLKKSRRELCTLR